MHGKYEKSRFSTNLYLGNLYLEPSFILELMQGRAIVTVESEYETAPKLSNGTSLNDL